MAPVAPLLPLPMSVFDCLPVRLVCLCVCMYMDVCVSTNLMYCTICFLRLKLRGSHQIKPSECWTILQTIPLIKISYFTSF